MAIVLKEDREVALGWEPFGVQPGLRSGADVVQRLMRMVYELCGYSAGWEPSVVDR